MKRQIKTAVASVSLLLLMNACKKNTGDTQADRPDATAAAKEWYYGNFNKSAEYKKYNPAKDGKKLPDWTRGITRTMAGLTITEFPLVMEKSRVGIAGSKRNPVTMSDAEKRQTAEATITRLLFFTNAAGHTQVRQVQYIPAPGYLRQHQYDISQNSWGHIDRDFTGQIVVTDWNNQPISRLVLQAGKITARGRYKGGPAPAGGIRGNIQPNSQLVCDEWLITEYERWCGSSGSGDVMNTDNCTEWVPTGWSFTVVGDCYEVSGCADPNLSELECLCQQAGMCDEDGGGDGGGDPDPSICDATESDFNTTTGTTLISTEDVGDISINAQGDSVRSKRYKWQFWHTTFLTYNWAYQSIDLGEQYKQPGSAWKFRKLNHLYEKQVGSDVFTSTCTVHLATPEVAANGFSADMTLDFSVKIVASCLGVSATVYNKDFDPITRTYVITD